MRRTQKRMVMTPAELKTYRETLGLPREWFAKKAGVEPRTVSYWESGKHKVPDDVAEMVNGIYRMCRNAADEAIKQVSMFSEANSIPEQINLLRYKDEKDLWQCQPGFNGLPVSTHAAMLVMITYELRLMGITCAIVYFDAEKYKLWVGNRHDNAVARSEWAALQ